MFTNHEKSATPMYIWFTVCALCMFVAAYIHLRSVEHVRLQEKHGVEKGVKIGKIYGTVSGTMESILLVGLWISPQPSFTIPRFPDAAVAVVGFTIPLTHLAISIPLILAGMWSGVGGVRGVGLEVAETHSTPMRLETKGMYSVVRHPQYLGWVLAHLGFSVLLSAWYSMLFTPVLAGLVYLISKKEEDELVREFGEEYQIYRKRTPMFIPLFRKAR